MDATQRYKARKASETKRYLKALTDVYDKIFAYDLSAGTVKCLHDSVSSRFNLVRDIPMQMADATEKWITDTVVPDDNPRVLAFFHAFFHAFFQGDLPQLPRISYEARSSTGDIRHYSGIILSISRTVSFYCCRRVPDPEEADLLRTENDSLKENMQALMHRFSDGMAGFELKNGKVTPLYVSDNICQFFGRTREEWLPMMEHATPIREFVSRSQVDYEKFAQLLENGEADFTYLNEYGISDIVETVDGKRRLVTSRVRCDLYDYLTGKEACQQLFHGCYLTNYSWSENTLAQLTGSIFCE